jgi:cytosine/uracil/thiamine/allantoin permease
MLVLFLKASIIIILDMPSNATSILTYLLLAVVSFSLFHVYTILLYFYGTNDLQETLALQHSPSSYYYEL